jgi:formylglycine-generating enzyme required for sulfatase activity
VRTFEIGKYPVTVAEYQRFIEDGGHVEGRSWGGGSHERAAAPEYWEDQRQYPNRAVMGVSWYEAAAYAAWCEGRLPREAEWELAARGKESREYAWGNEEPDGTRANYLETGPRQVTPVGLYPWGATPEGVQDMGGNVWEWVDDWYDKNQKERVLRGGSCFVNATYLRASIRFRVEPESRHYYFLGFRVARDVFP